MEEKNNFSDFGYMNWWAKKLDKMPFDALKSMWCRKNLPATIWILCMNPAVVMLYLTGGLVFLLLFAIGK